jgi:hypothetical protein
VLKDIEKQSKLALVTSFRKIANFRKFQLPNIAIRVKLEATAAETTKRISLEQLMMGHLQ